MKSPDNRHLFSQNQKRVLLALMDGYQVEPYFHVKSRVRMPSRCLLTKDLCEPIPTNVSLLKVLQGNGWVERLPENQWRASDKAHDHLSQPSGIAAAARAKKLRYLETKKKKAFGDPVDALLEIGFDTKPCEDCVGADCPECEGSGLVWKNELPVRMAALEKAAPYCRPKLQAVFTQKGDGEMTHTQWLKKMQGKLPKGNGIIDVTPEDG